MLCLIASKSSPEFSHQITPPIIANNRPPIINDKPSVSGAKDTAVLASVPITTSSVVTMPPSAVVKVSAAVKPLLSDKSGSISIASVVDEFSVSLKSGVSSFNGVISFFFIYPIRSYFILFGLINLEYNNFALDPPDIETPEPKAALPIVFNVSLKFFLLFSDNFW